MKQVILRIFVIVRANRIFAILTIACNAEPSRPVHVRATGGVRLSRMVTGQVSFASCRGVLPIVGSPGNVYCAPRIRIEL